MSRTIDEIDRRATDLTRRRYDRNARFYDFMERGGSMDRWRERLWPRVRGPRVLEVGVGTGRNLAFYPRGVQVTGVDLSPRMLERARRKAAQLGLEVDLREADAQALPFPDASFDTVVATCVFCSVPDPVLGLRELRRVLVPGGQLLTLDHVLSSRPGLRQAMHLANPLVVRLTGANIDRETVANVRQAGFEDVQVEDLWLDVMKLIEARAPGG